jgi:hypothetical protein
MQNTLREREEIPSVGKFQKNIHPEEWISPRKPDLSARMHLHIANGNLNIENLLLSIWSILNLAEKSG